jgi:HrpA-like RNA helicase
MAIMAHEAEVLELVDAHSICGVQAATATGKTRYLPFLLYAQRQWKVRVAIPTTVSVRDAYRFVAERCASAHLTVGFAAARVARYNAGDALVYGTTGHFASLLISLLKTDASRADVKEVLGDVLMVDEVHLMSKDTTLLLGLLIEVWPELATSRRFMQAAQQAKAPAPAHARKAFAIDGTPPPRILFSSATFDRSHLTGLFGEFPVLQLPSVHFPIEDFYLSHTPAARDVDDIIVRIVKAEFDKWQAETDVRKRGHVLVFRPGQVEVETTMFALSQAFPIDAPVVFYPAFSYLAPEEIDEIFLPSPDRLKVVVSTNIAESSITIEDVVAVVDDCWEKQAETSATGGYRLSLVRVAQQAAVQRRGRTGRTMPGRCYRLCSISDFQTFQFDRTREIDRVPIFNEVLKLFDANIDPRRVLQISDQRLNQALLVLFDLSMCAVTPGSDGAQVTAEGRFVAQLQMGVFNAHLIFEAHQRLFAATENAADDALIATEKLVFRSSLALAALLESCGPSYFYVPRRDAAETLSAYESRRRDHVREFHSELFGATDVHTLIALFWAEMTMAAEARDKDKNVTFMLRDWAGRHCINHKKLKEGLALDAWLVRHFRVQLPDTLADFHLATFKHYFAGDEPIVPRQAPTLGELMGLPAPKADVVASKQPTIEQLGDTMAELFARAYARNLMTLSKSKGRTRNNKRPQMATYKSSVFDNTPHKISTNDLMCNMPRQPHESIIVANITQLQSPNGIVNLCSVFVPGHYLPRSAANNSDSHSENIHKSSSSSGGGAVSVSSFNSNNGNDDDDDDDDEHIVAHQTDDAAQAEQDALILRTVMMLEAQAKLGHGPASRQSVEARNETVDRMARALASLSLQSAAAPRGQGRGANK